MGPTGSTRKHAEFEDNMKDFFEGSDIGEPSHALTGSMHSLISTLQVG